ncbi:MAG: substrate-binding domain-containing protein [Gemmatimonadota bacterium]
MRNTCLVSLLLLGAGACDAGRRGSATVDSATDRTDTTAAARTVTPFRLANDGTLRVLTMSPLTGALRVAADSFSVREAVRVLLDTIPTLQSTVTVEIRSADIVAISSEMLSRRLVGTERATWSLPFARNRIVLAWSDSSRRAAQIDSASWRRVLARRDVRVGRVDPARAPLGVHTLLTMQLAEKQLGESGLAKQLLAASPAARTYPSSDSLLAALRAHSVDVVWSYESVARAAGLRWLNLGPAVDLGEDAKAATYDSVSTVVTLPLPLPRLPPASDSTDGAAGAGAVVPANDSVIVHGVPLRYALTIPRESANLALAERFVRFLFSPDGQRILRDGPFDVLDALVVVGSGVPTAVAVIADSVTPLSISGAGAPPSRP